MHMHAGGHFGMVEIKMEVQVQGMCKRKGQR
jgi:hypothetical protein